MTIGDYLKRSHLTQEALARRAGVTRPYVSHILRGKRPSPEVARRIEAATEGAVSSASLLGISETRGEAVQLGNGRWVLRPGADGEVSLPPRLLADLGVQRGETLALRVRGDEIVITSASRDLQKAQTFVAKHARKSGGVVEEFVAERRAEADRE